MNLYEINAAIREVIDMETGEILDAERLNALGIAWNEKVENIILYIKNLDAETAAIVEEIGKLTERRRLKERKADSLRQYLQLALEGRKFESAKCAVNYRKSQAVEIENEDDFLAWVSANGRDDLLTYQKPKVNKTEVKAALNAGVAIPGAALVERQNMQIK